MAKKNYLKDKTIHEDADKKALQTLHTRLQYAKNGEKEEHNRLKKVLKVLDFKREVSVGSDTRVSSIKYPLLWSAYDNYISTLSTNPPQIVIDADGKEDFVKKIYWRGVLEYAKRKIGVEDLEESFIQSLIVSGKGVWKVSRSVETVKETTDITDLDGNKVGENTEEAIVKNISAVETVDPRRVYISPETKYKGPVLGDECPYIIEEMHKTPDYILETYGVEVSEDECEQIDDETLIDGETSKTPSDYEDKDDMKRVRFYAYYGVWKVNGKLEKNAEVLFTKKRVVKQRKFPYQHGKKPYIYALNFKDFFKPTARGSLDAVMDLDQEYNENMNRIRTYIRRMVNPKWAKLKGTKVDEAALLDPDIGVIVDESEPNAVRPLVGPTLDAAVFDKATSVEQLFQLLTGIVYGSTAIKNAGTATGQGIVERGADVKIGRIARVYERACEERDIMLLQLEQEYAPTEGTDIRITGADVVQQIKNKKALYTESKRLYDEQQGAAGMPAEQQVDENGQPIVDPAMGGLEPEGMANPTAPMEEPVDEYEKFEIAEDGRSVVTNYTREDIQGLFELKVISQSSNRANRAVQASQIEKLLPQTINEPDIRKALWRRLAVNYGWDEVVDAVENMVVAPALPTGPLGPEGGTPTEGNMLAGVAPTA